MTRTPSWRALALMLLPLAALLTGCATRPPQSVLPQMPALPPEARQPAVPAWCSPTCSAALQAELQSWQRRLMRPTLPALPASAPLMP